MEFIFIIAVVILIIWLITSPRSNSNKKKPKVLDNPRQSIKETPDTPASKVSLSRPSSDVTSSINPIKTNKASVSVELHEQMNELKTAKQTDPKPRITVVNTPTPIIESADSSTHSKDDLATFNIFDSTEPQNISVKSTRKAQWLDKNKETVIHKRNLAGFFYLGEQMESLRGYDPEPALLNPILPASTPLGHQLGYYTDESLGYWPSYSNLSRPVSYTHLTLPTNREV